MLHGHSGVPRISEKRTCLISIRPAVADSGGLCTEILQTSALITIADVAPCY